MVSRYPLHVCINTRQSRISRSSSCLSESPRNSSRVTSQRVYVYQTRLVCAECIRLMCVHAAYNVVLYVIDIWDVCCETHTMTRGGTLHIVTVAFFKAARKIFCCETSSPHASVIGCDVANVWIDAMCVYVWMSYMRFNTCGCICGHGCIGHTSTVPQPMSTECIASCSLASAIDGATSLWCTRGYNATTNYSVADAGVC